jgi:ABC-2 type transport system ATP-binding protein
MSRVRVSHLTKSYGSTRAVVDVSLDAGEREILALVGPDGAGKTSIFRCICGLLEFDSGQIEVAGFDVSREFGEIKPFLGYMPQTFSLYPDLSVEENLRFYAGLFGLDGGRFRKKKTQLYDFSGLGPFHARRAGALSGGMKQKLALSCALVHDPQVLVLDEPTTGVDPLSRRQFWDILRELKAQGSTILISTPYMDEVELSDRAAFIHLGKKTAEGTPAELIGLFSGKVYRLNVAPTRERMQQLDHIVGLKSRRFGASIHVYTPQDHSLEEYRDQLSRIGIGPQAIEAIQPELEDTFIQLLSE